MSPYLAPLRAFTAGFVDTTGFVALFGLFTAHVTGNFVLIGAVYCGVSSRDRGEAHRFAGLHSGRGLYASLCNPAPAPQRQSGCGAHAVRGVLF